MASLEKLEALPLYKDYGHIKQCFAKRYISETIRLDFGYRSALNNEICCSTGVEIVVAMAQRISDCPPVAVVAQVHTAGEPS